MNQPRLEPFDPRLGLQSSRMKHLNGLVACVREHRRYGHPCFVPKPDSNELKLRLCVRWENSQENSNGALLLEPRFLSPCLTVPPLPQAPPAPLAPPPPESQLNKEASNDEPLPDTTLLTAKRRLPLNWNISCEGSGALRAIDEVEPTICHLPNASRHRSAIRGSLKCLNHPLTPYPLFIG